MQRSFVIRPRRWLAIVQVVLLLATFVVPVAAADQATVSGYQWLQVLRSYGIVKGDTQGNLNLDKPIKRSEMITIMVRAMGGEQDAALYRGFSRFSDAKGHWAEGYIAYAAVKGLVKGDGDDKVRPEDPITYGEALTMVLRLIGKEPTSGDWPVNVLLTAADLKLAPAGLTAGTIKEFAVRANIFESLAKAATTIPTASGKTFLQTYVDTVPPGLEVASVPEKTKQATVKVTGTAKEAVSLTINGTSVPLVAEAFTYDLNLEYGQNNIAVDAFDLAGNRNQRQLKVTREYPVSRLEVTGPNSVRVNETVKFTVTGYDENNKVQPVGEVSATASGTIGTIAADGTFKAAGSTASGSITFKAGSVSKTVNVEVLGVSPKVTGIRISPVDGGQTVPVSKPMTVKVQAVDLNNQVVTEDNGREIILTTGGTGLFISPSKASTVDGVATFTVSGTVPGTITLTASTLNLPSSAQLATFGTTTRVVLVADSTALVSGGTPSYTRIRAELRDENGNLSTNNSGSDIAITLTQSGANGSLVDPTLMIRRGTSSSLANFDDGQFNVITDTGTTTVIGTITSGHPYTVDPLNLSITRPSVGSGSRLQVLNVNSGLAPNAEATLLIRVIDGAGFVVNSGSYAFKVKVDTSNNETKTNGLPDGVVVTLGNTVYRPIDTGATPTGNYVVGRTQNGQAILKVQYNKSGVVTLTPISLGYTSNAYADDGSLGAGNDSYGLTAVSDRVLYTGAVTGLSVTADSAIGNDQSAGTTSASTSNYFVVRATALDATGGRVPGATVTVKLEPIGATNVTTAPTFPNDTVNSTDGKSEFRVYAKTTVGCDTYKATSGVIQSNEIKLCVRNAAPGEPRIIAMRGSSGINNRVLTTDTNLEVELAWKTTGDDTWVAAVVYRGGSVIYTSNAVDMSSPGPRILIPRSVLTSGGGQYQIALKNGVGEGPRSAVSETVTVDYETANIYFTSGRYDASDAAQTGHKLYVYGSGFSTGDSIDTGKLVLKDASSGTAVNLQGATWSITNNGQFVVDLNSAPAKKAILESAAFSGTDVTLESLAGWYYQAGGAAASAVAAKPVTPAADIISVSFDVVNNQLIINGLGLTTGNLDIAKVSITQGANSLVLDNTNVANVTRTSDSQVVATLTAAGANLLKDPAKFNGTDVLSASLGWLIDSGFQARAVTNVPISAKVQVTQVTYQKRVANPATPARLTILGSGFFSGMDAAKKGSVDLSKLLIKDLSVGGAGEGLNGIGAAVNVVSDGEIVITIDDTDAQLFEGTYGGSDIYLVGQSGWFKDFQQRSAGDIPDRYFRLTIN